jgi:hypothetical protein
MPDLKQFDEAVAALRDGVAKTPAKLDTDGMTAIQHSDEPGGPVDFVVLCAWGESAQVLMRRLKLAPGQTQKYIRD